MADIWDAFPDAPATRTDAPTRITVSPRARDLVTRTVLGEAANEPDEGMAAVAAVIRNRTQSGKWGDNPIGVITAKNQFEPWNTQAGRSRMFSHSPDSPAYMRAAAAVDRVFNEDYDPTNGATHFFAPRAQAALGRQVPSWAQGEPLVIGGHNFYAPEGLARQRVASAGPTSQEALSDPWASFPDAPTGMQFQERLGDVPRPENAKELQAGLQRRAADMTTGPATTGPQRMMIEHQNVLSAASQRATPNMDILRKNLISTQAREMDDGSIWYVDPQTGQQAQTDNTKHIALTDPADGSVKIYARTPETEETLSGRARVLAQGFLTGAPTKRAAIPYIKPKASDVFATAKPHYREFDRIAKEVAVNEPGQVIDRLRRAMEAGGVPEKYIDEVLSSAKSVFADTAPKELSGVQRLEAEMNRLPVEVAPGKEIAVDALRRAKELMGGGFKSNEERVRQGTSLATKELVKIINELSPEAGAALGRADDIHSTAISLRGLQRKGNIAEMRAGSHRSAAVDRMVTQLRQVAEAAENGKMTGFKPDEIAAIRDIVTPGFWRASIDQLAKAAPSRGLLPKVFAVTAAAGAPFTGGATLALPIVGSIANKLSTVLTGRKIERLNELVAKRSPAYAEAVQRAVDKYKNAQTEWINEPTMGKFSSYLSSARALSAGLTRDGIPVTSGDLLKAIQGPVKSAAEDEPPVPRGPGQ